MTSSPVRARAGLALLVAWLVLCLVAAVRLEQGILSDPGWGILAAEQWQIGRSPGPRTLVEADPRALSAETAVVVSWWPPSYQALPWALHALLDLDWGGAVRATVILAWLCSMVGWGLYFRLACGRELSWVWPLLAFATSRHAHAGFDKYDGGENLLLAAFPWLLLLNARALAAASTGAALVAGAATAGLFAVKYSALLACVALGAAWSSSCLPRPSLSALRLPLGYALGAAATWSTLHAVGIPGGPTPADAATTGAFPARALYPLTLLPLALTDLDSLVQFIAAHPSRPWLRPWDKWVLGAPLLLAVAVLTWRCGVDALRAAAREPLRAACLRCAAALVVFVPLLLGVLLARGATIDDSARHVRTAALAALPFVMLALAGGARVAVRSLRVASRLAGLVLLVLPCAYGAATLIDKAFVRPPAGAVGASGLRLDLLGPNASPATFVRALRQARPELDAIVYMTSPELALELADVRLIVRHADFMPLDVLASERFSGCPRGGVLLALPTVFEPNGKARVLREAFVHVAGWKKRALPGAKDFELHQGRCEGPLARASTVPRQARTILDERAIPARLQFP